jgi:hypothetical protein
MSVYKLKCPHCGRGIRVRNSTSDHPLLRVYYLQCTNVACGCTLRSEMVVTHQMSPSAMPNPQIRLPLADSALRAQAMASSEHDNQLALDISASQ